MVSIKDIAKKCNVSVATVSKALNNQKDISDATKKKVKKIAEQMGYTTNVAARALKTNKTSYFIHPFNLFSSKVISSVS